MNNIFFDSNIFFLVNHYYVALLNPQKNIQYYFHYLNKNYYLEIKNKENQPLTIYLKIITQENKCFYYSIKHERSNFITLKNFNTLQFHNEHLNSDHYNMHKINKKMIENIFPWFNMYNYNHQLFNLDLTSTENQDFLIYNWYYFGQYNKFQFWKYILYKNAHLFETLSSKLDYQLTYNEQKKYGLVFIDDRFDDIFKYILTLFKYGVNNEWNLHIFTQEIYFNDYSDICTQLNIKPIFHTIHKINSINEYSNVLKSVEFWNTFLEETVLIFQYDSCCFKKIDPLFLTHTYIGAQWPTHIQQIPGIFNGNGGTSLRNVKLMKYICEKYFYLLNDEKTPEDMYFSKYLYQENLLNNCPNTCDTFSMENVYCENSIFGHAIYECISLDKLEDFLMKRIKDMVHK